MNELYEICTRLHNFGSASYEIVKAEKTANGWQLEIVKKSEPKVEVANAGNEPF